MSAALSKSQEFLLRLVMVITFCSLVVMTNVSQLFTVGTFVVVRDIDGVSVFETEVFVPLIFIDFNGNLGRFSGYFCQHLSGA